MKSTMRALAGGALAFAAALALGAAPAHAFNYTINDLVLVISKNGAETALNLGQASSTSVVTRSLTLQSGFGGNLTGATFRAIGVPVDQNSATFDGYSEYVFTSNLAANPLSFQSNNAWPDGLTNVTTLTSNGPNGYLPPLATLPPQSTTNNTATQVDYAESQSFSYKFKLNGSNNDTFGGQFPFSIANPFGNDAAATQIVNVYKGKVNSNFDGVDVTLLGTLSLSGSQAVFTPIPEPGTAMLMIGGLAGLAFAGSRKRS